MSTLQEDLALERAALATLRRDEADAWVQRRYADALSLRAEMHRAQERIAELEEREQQ